MKINVEIKYISPEIAKHRPSFLSGFLSFLDYKPQNKFNGYLFSNDAEDTSRDWQAVGNDIKIAMDQYGK